MLTAAQENELHELWGLSELDFTYRLKPLLPPGRFEFLEEQLDTRNQKAEEITALNKQATALHAQLSQERTQNELLQASLTTLSFGNMAIRTEAPSPLPKKPDEG